MSEDRYMQLALEQARQAVGRTCPNPPVGAVVVLDDEVIGRGFHPEAGQPHAEVFALRDAGASANGADLYVTLEPCCHQGKTGPCTEAIIAAGISRVFVGVVDPNPRVAGDGIRRLEEAGIHVSVGILEKDCRRLIAPFARHIRTGRPLVTLKMAMTLDGQTATSTGDSRWISGEESRLQVHRMRDCADAIMVGVGTVLKDDPLLTTRLPNGGRDPLRVVVDTRLETPVNARMLTEKSAAGTLIFTTREADETKARLLEEAGAEIVIVDQADEGVDLPAMMELLGQRNVQSVRLEGGAILARSALHAGVVDRVAFFIAPKLLGGDDGRMVFAGPGVTVLNESLRLGDVEVTRFGDDILIEGEVS